MSPMILQVVAVLLAPAALAGLLALRSRIRGRRLRVVFWSLVAVGWGIVALSISARLLFPCAPRLCLLSQAVAAAEGRTLVEDRHGSVLAALEPGLTPWVPLEEFPTEVTHAVLQREDRRFSTHRGVDPIGVIRAGFTLLRPGRPQGASTVAMQTAQCVVGRFGPGRLPPEERFSGKLAEVAVGANLVHRLGHERTLELYLNCVPMWGGRGLEAAARFNFGVGIREVSVQQALLLAAMIRAPSTTNPVDHPERARQEVRAFAEGLVRREALDPDILSALSDELNLASRRYHRTAFSDPIRFLRAELGESRPGVRVSSTLDGELQLRAWGEIHALLARVDRRLEKGGARPQAVFLAVDSKSRIRAYVAGRGDKGPLGYDRIQGARIQMASTEKPLILADAMEQSGGLLGLSTPVAELRCPDHTRDPWLGRVWGSSDPGRNLGEAMAASDNWMAVCLLHHLSTGRRGTPNRVGLPPYAPHDVSTALGTATVGPLSLAQSYVGLLTGGNPPALHMKAETSKGRGWISDIPVLRSLVRAFRHVGSGLATIRRPSPQWSDATVSEVKEALEQVVVSGTGQGARALRADGTRVGLKTGTASGPDGRATEMIVVGFVEHENETLVGLLWLGFDTPAPLPLTGGAAVNLVPTWAQIMAPSR